MNFLLVSQNAGSKYHGMVIRNYNWAKTLVDKGHEVTIVASAQSHSRHTQPATLGRVSEEIIDGVKYVWLWGPKYSGNSNVMRILSMAIFCLQLYLPSSFLKRSYDVVIASTPPPFSIFPAVRLAKKLKAKLVYDIRDLWPLTPKLLGGHSAKHPLIRIMQYAECYALKHADVVTAVPHRSEKYLMSKGMKPNTFYAFRNGICESEMSEGDFISQAHGDTLNDFRQQYSFIVGYSGAIGRANAMDYFVKAMVKTSNEIGAVLVGDGPFEEKVRVQIQSLGLEKKIIILPPIAANQVNSFLQHVDVTYCGMQKSPLYEYGASPTKLNDYMMAEKPIIYAVDEPENAIDLSGAGISCGAEDENIIAEAINKMASMSKNELQAMGAKGKIWALEHVSVAKQMDILVKKLQGI